MKLLEEQVTLCALLSSISSVIARSCHPALSTATLKGLHNTVKHGLIILLTSKGYAFLHVMNLDIVAHVIQFYIANLVAMAMFCFVALMMDVFH